MRRLSRFRLVVIVVMFCMALNAQQWKPAMDGIAASQWVSNGSGIGLDINFKSNAYLGKDFIYGFWFDEDSLIRCVGYREGGKWKSLPFSVSSNSSYTGDIVQYGDTLYIGGLFTGVTLDKDSTILPRTSLLKVFKDSIWGTPIGPYGVYDLSVSGDSVLAWASVYFSSSDTTGPHILSTNGNGWHYPFSILHPTESVANFGAYSHAEIWNGQIYTLNDARGGVYSGVISWDGNQWKSYGNGVRGTYSSAYDFEFYNNELYMAGSFTKQESALNPGEFIVRWDGSQWQEMAGGCDNSILDLFVHDNVLFCLGATNHFGDANIPVFAGWDGVRWGGTPIQYIGGKPISMGYINDTLYCFNKSLTATADGHPLSYINYFDGDYLYGSTAIYSTPDLGEEEVGIENLEVKVFPIPANDFLNIALPQEIETASYELLTLDGKLVQIGVLDKGENTLKINYKLSGVFLLKVQTPSGVVLQKVFFEN